MTDYYSGLMEELLKSFGGNAALLLALAYLIKTLVSSRFEKDAETFKATLQTTSSHEIEAFKTKLQSQANIEIERLRNSLQIAALEHQIRFSTLHEKRVELIAQLFKQIEDLSAVVFDFVQRNPHDKESLRKAWNGCVEFKNLIQINRVLLPSSALGLLDYLADKLWRVVTSIYVYWTEQSDENLQFAQAAYLEQRRQVMKDALTFHTDELPELKRKIEAELRKLLEPVSPESA